MRLALLLSLLVTSTLARAAPLPGLPELQASLDQFAPTPLEVDLGGVTPVDRKALARLVQAARIMDPLFMRQSWGGSEAWLVKLARDTTPLAQARLRYLLLNQGPWDRLQHGASFLPGVPARPASRSQSSTYSSGPSTSRCTAHADRSPSHSPTRSRQSWPRTWIQFASVCSQPP